MQVETFECHETASEPIEACEEAVGLMEALGLSGQKELTTKTDKGKDARCPYREMTAEEQFVYKVLCPKETNLQKYGASPIPLRVLQVAAHANSLGMFSKLVVWDRTSAVVKDPVLIGYAKDPERSWQDRMFILARWGSELEAFATLVRQVMTQKREQILSSLRRLKAGIDGQIASAEVMSEAELMKLGAAADAKLEIS